MQAHEGFPQHNIQQVPMYFHVLIFRPWTPTRIFKIILQNPCEQVKVDMWAQDLFVDRLELKGTTKQVSLK